MFSSLVYLYNVGINTCSETIICPVLSTYSFVCHSPLLGEELDRYIVYPSIYDPVGAFPHQLLMYRLHSCAVTDGNSHLLLSTTKSDTLPSCRDSGHSESLSENHSAACSITEYSCTLHYTMDAVTSCTHFTLMAGWVRRLQ